MIPNNYNVLTSLDFQDPNYGLPLFLKVTDSKNNAIPLNSIGHAEWNTVSGVSGGSPSGLPLLLFNNVKAYNTMSGVAGGNPSGLPLFLKLQIDPYSSGMPLYTVNRKSQTGNMPLFLKLQIETFPPSPPPVPPVLPLPPVPPVPPAPPRPPGSFNLYLHNPKYTNTGMAVGINDLYLHNVYQGGVAGGEDDPNWTIGTRYSGNLNLFVQTDPYIDHAKSLNLVLNPGKGYIPPNSVSGEYSDDMDFYLEGSVNPNAPPREPGPTGDKSLNLFIKNQDVMANLDLFVYNNNVSGNLPLYVSGTKTIGLGMPLLTDGKINPSGNITLFQRGYEPYV